MHAAGGQTRRCRNGRLRACDPCRMRKVGCDHQEPICTRCRRSRPLRKCVYSSPDLRFPPLPPCTSSRSSPSSTPVTATTASQPSPSTLPDIRSKGFMGATSYSSIIQQTESELISFGESSVAQVSLSKDGGPPLLVATRLSSEDARIAIQVLQNIPAKAESYIRIQQGFSPIHTLGPLFYLRILDSLWAAFGSTLEQRADEALTQMAEILCHNSSKVLHEDMENYEDWINGFSGHQMRWEALGAVFISWAFGVSRDITVGGYQTELGEYKICSQKCIDFAIRFGTATVLLQHLMARQAVTESVIYGDSSKWKRVYT